MIEGVTIDQLRTLRAVVDAGSFSGAARALGRVQGAVSQSIDRLEAQLGLRLFDRSGRTPQLTAHGKAIAEAANAVQLTVIALDELVQSLKRGEETRLAIAVDALFPPHALVSFAQDFAATFPAVELVILTETLSAVTAYVRDKEAAWGIALADADQFALQHRRVASVQLIPVAAPSHPLALHDRPADDTALSNAVQVVLSERRRHGEATTVDRGVLSPRTWRVVDLASKHALIAGGLGWGMMPEHLVRDDLQHGRLAALRIDALGVTYPTLDLVLVSRKGALAGPVAKWAQERLTSLCRHATASEIGEGMTSVVHEV